MNKFWMVFNPRQGAPRIQHAAKVLATAEAARLAGLNPNQEFFVLQTVSVSRTASMPVTTTQIK